MNFFPAKVTTFSGIAIAFIPALAIFISFAFISRGAENILNREFPE